jgi:5-methyltetrahydrofolate--homocysteine methyltransferase
MVIIGEKINGSVPSVAAAIRARDAGVIRDLAAKQAASGAAFIDVCASVPPARELETLRWLIASVQEATDTPVAVDSPSAETCVEAMAFCDRPGLINSVSLEGDKIARVFPRIAGTSWECVALLCGNTAVPATKEARLAVFADIMELATEYGVDAARLHIDPVVPPLYTSEDGILSALETMREIKRRCPAVRLTAGASNISFNLPARRYLNQGFILLSLGAGMDSALLDPLDRDMIALIHAAEALLGRDECCMDYIGAYRAGLFGTASPPGRGFTADRH